MAHILSKLTTKTILGMTIGFAICEHLITLKTTKIFPNHQTTNLVLSESLGHNENKSKVVNGKPEFAESFWDILMIFLKPFAGANRLNGK